MILSKKQEHIPLMKYIFSRMHQILQIHIKNSLVIFLFYFVVNAQSIYATSSNKTVNILTWWGYLDKPWVEPYIRQKCNANISFDEYYTNDEFLRRYNEEYSSYDIIIYADTIYNLVISKVKNTGIDISSVTKDYLPYIKKNYENIKYPSNTVYFFHAVSGFLWNSNIINIEKRDNIETILNKSHNNIIVMIDDPIETRLLIQHFNKNNLINSLNSKNLFISNDLNPFFNNKHLAIAYVWSGEAHHDLIRSTIKYKFLIHPKYSFFSSDLITVLNKHPSSICVIKTLSSKDFLNRLQNDTYYISPYGEINTIKNEKIKEIYKSVVENISTIQWVKPLSKDKYYEINQTWNYLKLSIYKNEIKQRNK